MTSNRDKRVDPDQVVSTTEARQGVTGHNVRYVLLAGTAGIVFLFVVVYAVYFS